MFWKYIGTDAESENNSQRFPHLHQRKPWTTYLFNNIYIIVNKLTNWNDIIYLWLLLNKKAKKKTEKLL